MRKFIAASVVIGGIVMAPVTAQAHCDTLDGPVAKAAIAALETGNVNAVLAFAPAEAETEITAVFEHARRVRGLDGDVRQLADRYFIETVVRLHRQGENAAYTGLKPAGMDFGPVIPAAEKALDSGKPEELVGLLTSAMQQQVNARFQHGMEARKLPPVAASHEEVAAARERVHAELGFVLYTEGLHQAIKGGAPHAEGGHEH